MKKERPVWVWVISIFYFVSTVWTLLSVYLIYSGKIPLQAAQKQYFESLTLIDLSISVGLGLLNLIGAVSLFMLSKIAFYIFGATLFVNITLTLKHALATGWVNALGGAGLIGAALGFLIVLGIFLYVKSLNDRGVLT